jgi:hypothetical protein
MMTNGKSGTINPYQASKDSIIHGGLPGRHIQGRRKSIVYEIKIEGLLRPACLLYEFSVETMRHGQCIRPVLLVRDMLIWSGDNRRRLSHHSSNYNDNASDMIRVFEVEMRRIDIGRNTTTCVTQPERLRRRPSACKLYRPGLLVADVSHFRLPAQLGVRCGRRQMQSRKVNVVGKASGHRPRDPTSRLDTALLSPPSPFRG